MKLEQSFEIKAPLDEVWEALLDLERVTPCLPGAAITERDAEGTYHGEFHVKLGPTTASYRGTIRVEDVDAGAHTATLRAKGSDKRGQGGASATIVNRLTEAGEVTRVDAVTDFTITGRLASFGRGGMMKDISNRLLADFAAYLQDRLAAQQTPAGAPDPGEDGGAALPTPGATSAAEPEAGASPGQPVAWQAPVASPAPSAEPGVTVRSTAPAAPDAPVAPPPPAPPSEPSKPLDAFALVRAVVLDRLGRALRAAYRALARLFGRRGR